MDIQKIRSYHSQISCMYIFIIILSFLGLMLNYLTLHNFGLYLIFTGVLIFSVIYLQPLKIMQCLNDGYISKRGLKAIDDVLSKKGEEPDVKVVTRINV